MPSARHLVRASEAFGDGQVGWPPGKVTLWVEQRGVPSVARRGSQYGSTGSSKKTLLYIVLGAVVLAAGGLFALTFEMEPQVHLVEKVFPDDRFPR